MAKFYQYFIVDLSITQEKKINKLDDLFFLLKHSIIYQHGMKFNKPSLQKMTMYNFSKIYIYPYNMFVASIDFSKRTTS